jgi:hypothetical protein
MKGKSVISAILAAAFGVAVIWAAEPWEGKPWTEWTEEDTDKMMQGCPWIRKGRIHTPALRETGYWSFVAAWSSSLTVRQLQRRLVELAGLGTRDQSAAEFPVSSDEYYMIAVEAYEGFNIIFKSNTDAYSGVPFDGTASGCVYPAGGTFCPFRGIAPEVLRESAYLLLKPGGKRIPALKANVGLTDGAIFYFPRTHDGEPIIGPGVKKVEFRCKTNFGGLRADFDLGKMVRDGKPDL